MMMLRQLIQNTARKAWYPEQVLNRASFIPSHSRWYSAQNNNAEANKSSAATPPPAEETAVDETADNTTSKIEELTTLLAEKEEKIAEMNDRTLRVLAEMENVRTIARRDVENARKYGIMGFAKSLLGVADNLGLALKSVNADQIEAEDCGTHLKGLFTGVKATESELIKVFAQQGITPFGAANDKFDPELHQAMYEAPVEGTEPGIILDVTKIGYTIGDRVLRPAEVGVSKGSS